MTTATAPAAIPANRVLPKRESDLFKQVIKYYESKQYKKALKQADLILKKFPNHGETLAMKGLTLNSMPSPQQEQAHALVRQALQYDMRSPVCWHVYGLYYRSHHEYDQAIRCYKQALSADDGTNTQILRDLSSLQIQLRDYNGFCHTRNTLLQAKPQQQLHWVAYSLARYLQGDKDGAAHVMNMYLSTTSNTATSIPPFEQSELAMYKNTCLVGKEALTHLEEIREDTIVDIGAWGLRKAHVEWTLSLYTEMKNTVVQILWERGMTEDYSTHTLFMMAVLEWPYSEEQETLLINNSGTHTLATRFVLTNEQTQRLEQAYAAQATTFTTSMAITSRIPLTLTVSRDEFQSLWRTIAQRALRKGVPSLCAELASYLLIPTVNNIWLARVTDPADIRVHERFRDYCATVEAWLVSLQEHQTFDSVSTTKESPDVLFWARYLRAGLHELAGEYTEGLAVLALHKDDDSVFMTDAWELQARLYRASGQLSKAVVCMEKACQADPSDRYLNNLCTEYYLCQHQQEKALTMMGMFTRHETTGATSSAVQQNLYDMQCSWYELQVGACHERQQDYGKALKQYAAVVKHFDDFQEDQFDFHSYCLRKVTLRAYIDVLRHEDTLYGHEYFCQAAGGLIRMYLHLYDHPPEKETQEPDYSSMTPAEKKKAKAIARKKKNKQAKQQQPAATTNGNGKKKAAPAANGKTHAVDEDPLGLKLLEKDPLEQATKYSLMLARFAPRKLESWYHQYDVAVRRKKPLLALQALFKAKALAAECDSGFFPRVVDFVQHHEQHFPGDVVSAPARVLMDEQTPRLLAPAVSVTEFVETCVSNVRNEPSTSLPARIAVAKVLWKMNNDKVGDAVSLLVTQWEQAREISVKTCRQGLEFLEEIENAAGSLPPSAVEWKRIVTERFPDAATKTPTVGTAK